MFEDLKELELLEIDGGCCHRLGEVCQLCRSPRMFLGKHHD